MKLYIWRPDGHGMPSFFVVAKSLEEALTARDAYLTKEYPDPWWVVEGFSLEVFDVGEVAEHDND